MAIFMIMLESKDGTHTDIENIFWKDVRFHIIFAIILILKYQYDTKEEILLDAVPNIVKCWLYNNL